MFLFFTFSLKFLEKNNKKNLFNQSNTFASKIEFSNKDVMILEIRGINVDFPYEPYLVQKAYMVFSFF
jgi:hypothetical protein